MDTKTFSATGELLLRAGVDYTVTRDGGTIQYHTAGEAFQDYAVQDLGVVIRTPPSGRIKVVVTGGPVTVNWQMERAKH